MVCPDSGDSVGVEWWMVWPDSGDGVGAHRRASPGLKGGADALVPGVRTRYVPLCVPLSHQRDLVMRRLRPTTGIHGAGPPGSDTPCSAADSDGKTVFSSIGALLFCGRAAV